MRLLFLCLLAAVGVAIPVFCQPTATAKPSFEVATVKPSDPGQRDAMIQNQPAGRFLTKGTPLRALITFAYRVRDFQISGGPGWIGTDRWDSEARAEEGSIPVPTGPPDPNTPDAIGIRLQTLLEQRFQLKTEGTSYLRTVDRQRGLENDAV